MLKASFLYSSTVGERFTRIVRNWKKIIRNDKNPQELAMRNQMPKEYIWKWSEEIKQLWWDKNKAAFLRRFKNDGPIKLPPDIESDDLEFVRACRDRLAQQLQNDDASLTCHH